MREVTVSEKCTGCGACYNICPSAAIEMRENNDGFLFPVINQEKCTDCGLCAKTCFVSKPKNFPSETPDKVYALSASDEIREKSSSGGIFTLIAEYIISSGGYVCGAAFSDDFLKVEHILINKMEDLHRLQTSKYVQSNTGNIYKKIKELLQNDFPVFFTGTPCQVEGLNRYLNKKYDNLFTADILCHGVPSSKVWAKYLEEISRGKRISSVNFRDKTNGWKSPLLLTIQYEDGTCLSEHSKENLYYKSFLQNINLRQSCASCEFTNLKRAADITLGDFWKIDRYNKKFNDKKGVSLVLVNSSKGQSLLQNIKSKLKACNEVPVKYAIRGNSVLVKPHKLNKNRDTFFIQAGNKTVCEAILNSLDDKYDGVIANLWDCNYNYGAILTAYALQQFFKDKNLDFRILNCNPKKNSKKYRQSFVKKFADKNLILTNYIKNPKALQELNYSAETFVVGSDQVFKDHCMKKYFNQFLLPYTDFSKKRIAFSASFGKENFDADDKDKYVISKYLKRFDGISVRETSGVELCKREFGVRAEHILDPVFLTKRENFLKFVDKNNTKYQDKIVCMFLDSSEKIKNSVKKLSQDLSAEVVNITGKNLPVEEFLTAIYSSKYFVTDSFHGTCFGILFHKNFVTLKNEDRGNARFDSLIQTFGLKDCFVTSPENITPPVFNQSIDWNSIENIISKEKEKANLWVENILNNPHPYGVIENEFDIQKYAKYKLFKNTWAFFSITKNNVRTTIQILGIKFKIKRK